MTLHHHAGQLTTDRLGPLDLAETFTFLDRDPVLNVYLIALTLRDALASPRDEYWAARRGGELKALLHLGSGSGAVLPHGADGPALRLLGEQAVARQGILPRRFQVVGARAAVTPFLETFRGPVLEPRLLRDQIYLSLEHKHLPPFERLPELRPAARADYSLAFESGAALRAEELDEDPRAVDPIAYARRVEDECRDGHTWLWIDARGLCFRASVSAVTSDAAQISGVYTPPERRGRGLATRALAELCARLFERCQAVCLFVNDFNAPARTVYRRLGFVERALWTSAFYDLHR